MSWKCRLGLHCWEEVDTDEELEKFADSLGLDKMCRPVRIMASESSVGDYFCPKCGKLDFKDLELNKKFLMVRVTNYVYKGGKVVKI